MSDLISRQQAIDALRDYLVEKRCPDDGTLTCRLIENEVINKLPSAQPELDIGNDGTLYISVSKGQLDKINRVLVEEDGSIFCKQFY